MNKTKLPKLNEYKYGCWYRNGNKMHGTCIEPILPSGYRFFSDSLVLKKNYDTHLWEFHVRVVGW